MQKSGRGIRNQNLNFKLSKIIYLDLGEKIQDLELRQSFYFSFTRTKIL